jgi:hypothetical protein
LEVIKSLLESTALVSFVLKGRHQIKKEAFIACPVCCSGSCFQLQRPEREFACESCQFVLAKNLDLNISEFKECIFCSSKYFYFEALLDLSFLGRASICYVCEARYKGIEIDTPDDRYNEQVARSARRSKFALYWKERAEQHNHQTDSEPVAVQDTIEP